MNNFVILIAFSIVATASIFGTFVTSVFAMSHENATSSTMDNSTMPMDGSGNMTMTMDNSTNMADNATIAVN